MLDPWENIHSESTIAIEAVNTANLPIVSHYYNTPKSHYCMVLGKCTHSNIICAHIWPDFTHGKGLSNLGLEEGDINNPRNFLRLHKTIESNFDKKRLTFLPVHSNDKDIIILEVFVLDPSLQ
jgi:hypothetical protein